jgi:hypothetical protein
MARRKLGVTTRALIQRINRALRTDQEALKTSRGERMRQAVGEHYIINYSMNAVTHHNVDPETLGRDLKVLNAWETVID